MTTIPQTPLGALTRGLAAGLIGAGVMAEAQVAIQKQLGISQSGTTGEIGKRILEGVFQREVDEELKQKLDWIVHSAYSSLVGGGYGLVKGADGTSNIRDGAMFGAIVEGMAFVLLNAMKLSPPPWEEPPKYLVLDVAGHQAYGVSTALAFKALSGATGGRR